MANLKGTDFYDLQTLLTGEEVAVQNMAHDFVAKEILPIIDRHHRDGTFPKGLMPKMGALGFLGPTLPAEYGGAGLNNVMYGLLMQELERGDSSMRSAASVQGSLVMYPIFAYGSEEQRKKWLPVLAKGEAIGCFGLTEPDFGSNPAGMLTKAVRKKDKWVLNGAKMWITNGTLADVAVVWARTDAGKVNGFLVEKGAKGFSAPETKGKFSLRASCTSELVLEEVEVPEANRFPNIEGLKGPLGCLTQARYGIAWGVLGLAMACYECAVDYSKTRIQFDKPIGGFQLTQKKLAEMLTEITKGQLLVHQLGRLKDAGKMRSQQVSMAKMNNCKIARDIARTAREILGANGILDEYPVIRHMMNIESVYTYEGTHEIHTLVLGEEITGIPAYR